MIQRKSVTSPSCYSFVAKCLLAAWLMGQLYPTESFAQGGEITSSRKRPVDVTKVTLSKCSETLTAIVGESLVEVKFFPGFDRQANQVMQSLNVVMKTAQKLLQPLRLNSIRFYLLPLAQRPTTDIVYNFPHEQGVYQVVVPLVGPPKNIDCLDYSELCNELFSTTPHELTHQAIDHLIEDSTARWFDEGLAEYIGWRVAAEIAPAVAENLILTRSPEASLHCPEIRQMLLEWNKAESFSTLKKQVSNLQSAWKMNASYGAAFQLVRLILKKAEQSGTKEPLGLLLESLEKFRRRQGRPAGGQELLNLIENSLHVGVRQSGVLSLEEQETLVFEAVKDLVKKENPLREFHALSVLACVDLKTDERTLLTLMRIAFDKDRDEIVRRLAATALVRRTGQPGFDNALAGFLRGREYTGEGSLANSKKFLASFSFRSSPRSK